MSIKVKDPLIILLGSIAKAGLLNLHSGRAEYACNSSSSHSVIILPPGETLAIDNYATYTAEEARDAGEYSEALIADSTEKLRYLAAAMVDGRPPVSVTKTSVALLEDLPEAVYSASALSSVGAPSLLSEDDFASFVKDLRTFISLPEVVVILNETDFSDQGAEELTFLDSYGDWVARKDTVDGESWWVLFDKQDGTKLRLNFSDASKFHATPIKAAFPELVDVKLTDRCPFELDCGFCYMGSTRKGAEASLEDVTKTLIALSEMKVFEIAFGGGEPTLWPHFKETLSLTRSLNMIPNFTTKNFKVLGDQEVLDLAGAVAFSITDRHTFERYKKEHAKHSSRTRAFHKVALQIIPEILPEDLVEDIFNFAAETDSRITLLGYKTTGRGDQFEGRFKRDPDFWFKYSNIKGRYGRPVSVSIDTAMAEQVKPHLEAKNVPQWSYHVTEGSFSMYCDAVNMKAGPSSYIEPSDMDEIGSMSSITDRLTELFATY